MPYTVDEEMEAFAVAEEHVTFMHGRGFTYGAIGRAVGLNLSGGRMVLIAKLARIWLRLRESPMKEAA